MLKRRLKIVSCIGLVYLFCWITSLFVLRESNDALLDAIHINDEARMSAGLTQDVIRRETYDEESPALRWKLPVSPEISRPSENMFYSPFIWDLWYRTWKAQKDKSGIDENTLSYLSYITQVNSDFKQYRQRGTRELG